MINIDYKTAYTPCQIAEENKLLNVPVYQRLFVWGEEQIELLLNDLKNVCVNNAPYYIGIITVVEKDGKWDIVDGQQRLTFLSLFGAYCAFKNKESIWKKFLFDNANNLRIAYVGRSEDCDDLKKIADGKFSKVKNQNFNLFIECMNKNFSGHVSENFAKYVYNNASFLITELPSDYKAQDLNLFFEKMNATGKQLTALEQIKGKYFPACAAEFDACLNFEKKFSETGSNTTDELLSLADILNDTERKVEQEEKNNLSDVTTRSIFTPEVFLLHCLEILEQKDMPRDERKILETFKNHVASDVPGKISSSTLLKTMKTYRKWLDENIIYLKASADGSWEYAFRRDNAAEDEDTSVDDKKMKQFQAMLYVSSSNYQEWVIDAYRSFVRGEVFSLELLTAQDQERHKDDSPAMTYPAINRYWFWKLDYLLWESFVEQEDLFTDYNLSIDEKSAIRNYKFRRNRSIEHLHPQTENGIEKWNDDAKHRFGNLAMISSSFNSLQQNDPIGVKFARLRDTQIPQKNLESIKMLLMFKRAGGNENGWTVDIMTNHEKEMLNMLGLGSGV